MKTQTFKSSTSIIVLLFMLALSFASCSEDEPTPKKNVTEKTQVDWSIAAQDLSTFTATVEYGVGQFDHTYTSHTGASLYTSWLTGDETLFIKITSSDRPMKVNVSINQVFKKYLVSTNEVIEITLSDFQ